MGAPEDNNKTIPSEVDQFKNSPKRDNAENDKAESSEKNENTVKKDDQQSGCVESQEDGGAKFVEESSDNEEGDADDEKGRNVKLTEKGSDLYGDSGCSDIEEDSDNEDGGGKV